IAAGGGSGGEGRQRRAQGCGCGDRRECLADVELVHVFLLLVSSRGAGRAGKGFSTPPHMRRKRECHRACRTLCRARHVATVRCCTVLGISRKFFLNFSATLRRGKQPCTRRHSACMHELCAGARKRCTWMLTSCSVS